MALTGGQGDLGNLDLAAQDAEAKVEACTICMVAQPNVDMGLLECVSPLLEALACLCVVAVTSRVLVQESGQEALYSSTPCSRVASHEQMFLLVAPVLLLYVSHDELFPITKTRVNARKRYPASSSRPTGGTANRRVDRRFRCW